MPTLGVAAESAALPSLASFSSGTSMTIPQLMVNVKLLPPGATAANCGTPIIDAQGDGVTDDGCALQAAMNFAAANGGGIVWIPKGSYFVNRTLLVGNNTWIIGEDKWETIVLRGDNGNNPDILDYDRKHTCGTSNSVGTISAFYLFVNEDYNCGNKNIVLANFSIDSTNAPGPCGNNSGPCTNANAYASAVTIALSAVEDTHIWNLHIKNAPQDAIFLRNGGNHTSVTDTTIDGFNMKWYNGAAINIEMWDDGYIGYYQDPVGYPPVTISGNTINSRSDQIKPNSKPEIGGINFNRPTRTPYSSDPNPNYYNEYGMPPKALIHNNTIAVQNKHTAIGCLDCIDSVVAANTISANFLAVDTTPVPAGSSPLFSGILASGDSFQILDNEIQGSGVADDGMGILVQSSDRADISNSGARIIGNVIRDKNLHEHVAALRLYGVRDATVMNNRLEDIGHQHPGRGIFIGSHCAGPSADDVLVVGNSVSMSDSTQSGYSIWVSASSMFLNNLENGLPLTTLTNYCPNNNDYYIFP